MNIIKTINYVSLKYTTHMTIYAPGSPQNLCLLLWLPVCIDYLCSCLVLLGVEPIQPGLRPDLSQPEMLPI